MAGREHHSRPHHGSQDHPVTGSLAAVLTSIQVDLTAISGKVDTLNASLDGRLKQQRDELERQRVDHGELKKELSESIRTANNERKSMSTRIDANTRFRWMLVGLAGSASFIASLLAQPVGSAIFTGG